MFDLPMDTAKEKRIYQLFRKGLIKEGFVMMQYSVYVRTCPTREYAKRLEKRVEGIAPEKGNVRLLTVTEKQYTEILNLGMDVSKLQEKANKGEKEDSVNSEAKKLAGKVEKLANKIK